MSKPEKPVRMHDGRPWRKGVSGNPKGRAPGTRNHSTKVAEALMASDLPEVVRRVIDAARGGDMVAAKLILERLVPLRRGAPVQLDLPKVNCARDVVAAALISSPRIDENTVRRLRRWSIFSGKPSKRRT